MRVCVLIGGLNHKKNVSNCHFLVSWSSSKNFAPAPEWVAAAVSELNKLFSNSEAAMLSIVRLYFVRNIFFFKKTKIPAKSISNYTSEIRP